MDFGKEMCPIVKVDGFIEKGKQFDIEINLPEDDRNVIFGVIKDCYKDPVEDAVVKLIEVCYEYGKEERKPVSHTFTDKDGEFVFGPLCPDKTYEILVWVNKVRHVKLCADCKRHGKCLKGVSLDCCDFHKEPCREHHEECKCKDKHEDKCKCEDKHEDKWEDKCKCKDKHEDKWEDKCKCEDKHEDKWEDKCKCEDKHEDKWEDKCKCEDKHEDKCKCECKHEDRPCKEFKKIF